MIYKDNDYFEIEGIRKLNGTIKCQKSKNATLPIMSATILIRDKVVLKDVPNIVDSQNMIKILEGLGGKVTKSKNKLIIDNSNSYNGAISEDLSKSMRSSIFLMGSMLARFNSIMINTPGGCLIGSRPIDIHIDAPDVWCFFNIKSAVKWGF